MKQVLFSLSALAMVLLLAVSAEAQPGGARGMGGRGMGGGMAGGQYMLLSNPQVQKELNILDEQKEELQKIQQETRDEMQKAFGDMRNASPEDRQALMEKARTAMQDVAKKSEEKYAKVLNADQVKRLKELYIQAMGVNALSNASIQKDLGMTEEQKTKLTKISEENRAKFSEMFSNMRGGGQGTSREEMRSKMEEMRKSTETSTLDVLTAEQKTKFEEMKGKKADFDLNMMGGRGQGGRGQGGRGQGGQGGQGQGGQQPGGNTPAPAENAPEI